MSKLPFSQTMDEKNDNPGIHMQNESFQNELLWNVGEIKHFNSKKGFGFARCWNDEKEYFVHISSIDNHQILSEGEYVIFKLRPSQNKPGTLEATNMTLVVLFTKDPVYLKEQYSKYNTELFRKAVLRALPYKYIIELFENAMLSFSVIQNDSHYNEFQKTTNPFKSIKNEKIKNDISDRITNHIRKAATPYIIVKFWLADILLNQPDSEILKAALSECNKEVRFEIFKKIDTQEKEKLLCHLISIEKPQSILDFVLYYLEKINRIPSIIDIKTKLTDKEYWTDKLEFNLYDIVRKQLIDTLEEKLQLSLFLNGYKDFLPYDYIISNGSELSISEIGQILESKTLNENDAFFLIERFFKKRLLEAKEIPSTDLPNVDADDNRKDFYRKKAEPLISILEIAKETLTESTYERIENQIIETAPYWLKIIIWESGYKAVLPFESISYFLLEDEKNIKRIEHWMHLKRISKDEIVSVLISNLKSIKEISTRKDFYLFNRHLEVLRKLEIDISSIKDLIDTKNIVFLDLAKWISGISEEFNFDEFKTKLIYLCPDDQIKFLKKIFWLSHTGKFSLTVDKLDELTRVDLNIFKLNKEFNPDIHLDISVDIVIEAIKAYHKNKRFLLDSELMSIVIKDLAFNKKHKFKIQDLFEPCMGRYEAKFNWDNSRGEIKRNNNHWEISFEYDEDLVNEVKKLPQRKYDRENKLWYVPLACEETVLDFAKKFKFFVDKEGKKYLNNTHLAEFQRTETPNGIIFCEGLKAKKKDQVFNREFWWCCNHPCFQNCEADHTDPEYIKGFEANKNSDDLPF